MITFAKDIWTKLVLTRRLTSTVLPAAGREMARWESAAERIPNPELRRQALDSLGQKRFHCEGGAVYAVASPSWADELVPLVVAYQTISDYLDNLCDRSVSRSEEDFRQLHRSMVDALSPDSVWDGDGAAYYCRHPNRDDGGYLASLVRECRRRAARLPGYASAHPSILSLVELYCDLQVYKHIDRTRREERLLEWFELHRERVPGLSCWEFAAAAGSTLAVFALLLAATNPVFGAREVEEIVDSYFPWICGLHILLDYLIDQAEDRAGGDLNFVSYYRDPEELRHRMVLFASEARRRARKLPFPEFHSLVVEGLMGVYFADHKVVEQRLEGLAREIMRSVGPGSWIAYWGWRGWKLRPGRT